MRRYDLFLCINNHEKQLPARWPLRQCTFGW